MKKKRKGRIMAGLLAVVMMCMSVPGTAYAGETAEKTLQADDSPEAGEGLTEGSIGEGRVPQDSEMIAVASVNGYSRESAVEWIKGKINTAVDYDGISGVQCVDLVKWYITTLGHRLGSIGYAYNLHRYTEAQLGLPSWGWARYGNSETPKPGDIVVFDAYAYGAYSTGHCGLIYAVDTNKYYYVDYNGTGKNDKGTWHEKGLHEFSSVIRPDFPNQEPTPPAVQVGAELNGPFTRTIADGDYHIVTGVSGINNDMCLETAGRFAHISHSTEDDRQIFTVQWMGERMGYKITHKETGEVLTVDGDNKLLEGWMVDRWPWDANISQMWAIDEVDDGAYYTVRARCSGFYMDVYGAASTDGTAVQVFRGNGTAAQKWRFIPAGTRTVANGDYYITTALDKNMCLNVRGASTGNEANVEIAAKKEEESRIFSVAYLNNGFYKILNKNSGKSLDVYTGKAVRGTNVQQYEYHGGLPQQWAIRSAQNGTFYIQPRCSGHYLDVANGNTADATNVWTTVWTGGSAAQRWSLEPVVKPQPQKLVLPTADIPTGTEVATGTKVSLSCSVSGAAIYYTLDGTAPGETSSCYTAPIVIEKDTTVKAVAVKSGYQNSDTAVFTYTVKKGETPEKPDVPENPDIPETSDRGEVLEEDVPQGKVENIPQGLWMSEVAPQTYTGKEIRPEVRVYDYKTRLEQKRDYTISYKNNVKANAPSGKNPPTITVAGKGNYTGKETQTFEILPKQLTDDDIAADSLTVSYTGKIQKPVSVVTWKGKRLAGNRDYKATYPRAKQTGVYTILLEGMGNYGGERQVGLTITQGTPVSKLRVDKIANQTYTGSACTPAPVVKNGRTVLTQGEDYTLSYQDNIEVGTAFVIITGKGGYAGEKRVSFRISADASLKNGKAELIFDHPAVYTGGEVKPDGYTLTVSVKNADGGGMVKTLAEGKDFTVSYKNNIRPGTASIFFQGINGYTGTLKKTYKISAYHIDEGMAGTDGKIRVEMSDSYAYAKGGCKPEPVVTFMGMTLKKGTDYTLSYKNNTALNDGSNQEKRPLVKIKGKGCFTGVREMTYKITPKDLGGLTMTTADKVWRNKGNICRTKVVIRDVDGKTLAPEKITKKRFGMNTARIPLWLTGR